MIYKSQGNLSNTSFCLGAVGMITQDDIHGFLRAAQQVLRR